MIRHLVAILATGILTASGLFSQTPQAPKTPKTKLEAFEAQSGMVIVRGSSIIGFVQGISDLLSTSSSRISVESQEFFSPASGKKEYGITIEVAEAESGRLNRSFIDYDEIDSLLSGIDYISKVDKSITKLDTFQADYHTNGDFEISTFSKGNDVRVAVSSGFIGSCTSLGTPAVGRVIAVFKFAGLAKIRELIMHAKQKLDSLRQ